MDIKYADLFSDEDDSNKNNLNNTNTSNKKNSQLLGKKSNRENELTQISNSAFKNKNINKNKKKSNNSFENNTNENSNNNENYISKKHLNDLYFLDNKIEINTASKYDFENPNKTKYQDILGNKKSILKIQEYVYNSHLTNTKINYKVITQIKTINFKTDNNLFQKGKQGKEINEEKYNLGQSLVEAGSMPSMGFWNQRYYYFTRFDQGILLDFESN